MQQDHWPRMTRFGLLFLVTLLIQLAGCSGSSTSTGPTPTTGMSSTTTTPTGTVSVTPNPNTPTATKTATATQILNTPTPTKTAGATPTPITATWSVSRSGNILQIGYGSGASFPQYGALDVTSGYFRLNYGPGSGWGTSIILLPAFWSKASCAPGGYCQGAPVTPTWSVEGGNLALTITGTIGGLNVTTSVLLSPPAKNSITAQVSTSVHGSVVLDNRPGEAFKPVMLSSMHDSSTQWDASSAYAGSSTFSFPASGWIIQPPVDAQGFSLLGGTSSWKTNAPTIQVTLDRSLQVSGWVNADTNPNDDNVGFWSATNTVLSSWSYTVVCVMAS